MHSTSTISITIQSPSGSDNVKINHVYRRDGDKTLLVVATFNEAQLGTCDIGTLTDTVEVAPVAGDDDFVDWKQKVFLLGWSAGWKNENVLHVEKENDIDLSNSVLIYPAAK